MSRARARPARTSVQRLPRPVPAAGDGLHEGLGHGFAGLARTGDHAVHRPRLALAGHRTRQAGQQLHARTAGRDGPAMAPAVPDEIADARMTLQGVYAFPATRNVDRVEQHGIARTKTEIRLDGLMVRRDRTQLRR